MAEREIHENAFKGANISNDDYTTYPVIGKNGQTVAVDVIENGKTFKFITPAAAKTRMVKQLADNFGTTSEAVENYIFNGGESPFGSDEDDSSDDQNG